MATSINHAARLELAHNELADLLLHLTQLPEQMEGFNEFGELCVLYLPKLVNHLNHIDEIITDLSSPLLPSSNPN